MRTAVRRLRILARLVAASVAAGVAALAAAAPGYGIPEPVVVTGTLEQLLATIPTRSPVTYGYASSSFPAMQPVPAGVATASDFGTRPDSGDAQMVAVIGAKAAWAMGGYAWNGDQRAAWSRLGREPLTPAYAQAVASACQDSSEMTCALNVLPQELRTRAAAAIVRHAVTWRLALTRQDKAILEPLIDQYSATLAPGLVESIALAEVPAQPGTQPQAKAVSKDAFGILSPPIWESIPTVPHGVLRLWDSGVSWRHVEPSPGNYQWDTLDHAVASAEQRGKKVLLVLGPVPQWASANPDIADAGWGPGAGGPLTAEGTIAYAAYVNAVAKRYGNRIWAYESWNEANLPDFWLGTPAEMAQMTTMARQAVRQAGARSLVLAASATTRARGSVFRFMPDYLAELARRNWPIDGYTVHPYPDADGSPADRVNAINEFIAILDLAGAPRLPVHDTEVNYGVAGPGSKPYTLVPDGDAGGWISQTFIDSARLGVATTSWFAWTPQPYDQLGVQLTPASTDAIQAWTATHAWLTGAQSRGCLEPPGAVICRFEREGKPFWIAYADYDAVLDVPAGATRWCDLQGHCRATIGTKFVAGTRPVRLS